MEIVQFFFSGPQWFLHFLCLAILLYVLSPTIEKHYYFGDREVTADDFDSGTDKKDSASQNDSKVSEE